MYSVCSLYLNCKTRYRTLISIYYPFYELQLFSRSDVMKLESDVSLTLIKLPTNYLQNRIWQSWMYEGK